MATGNFYRGTSQTQDARFSNKDKKLLNSREWPPEFDLKVNIKKVELNAIKPWISKKITEILGFEDEVVINLAVSELESQDEKGPCPKKIQLNLTGFLSNKAGIFMRELWKLLLEAQETSNGIPPSLIEERKEEIKQKKEEIINQEAKLESIRAFLKQAGEEIKSKLNHKKGTHEREDNHQERKKGNSEKINEVLGEEKEKNITKEKKHTESKKYKKNEEKDRKSESRSRSRSHHRKKNKQKKSKDKHKNKGKRSRSHSKDHKKDKNSNEEKSNLKKAKGGIESQVTNDQKKKMSLSSGSEESGGSSDESSPISEASSD